MGKLMSGKGQLTLRIRTKRISIIRAQIINLHHNTIPSHRHQFITRAASGSSSSARPNTEDSLADGGVVAGVVVETAGGGGGVAVSGTECVARAVAVEVLLVVVGGKGRKKGGKGRSKGKGKLEGAFTW